MPAHLYCNRKGCAVVSVHGSFSKGKRYACPECKHALSESKKEKK